MKVELEISEKNEGTSFPWWLILDPQQMMKPDCYVVANMITGPFFSREEAQEFLDRTSYNFSKRAIVYCHSGHHSDKYREAIKKAIPKLPF